MNNIVYILVYAHCVFPNLCRSETHRYYEGGKPAKEACEKVMKTQREYWVKAGFRYNGLACIRAR